MLTRKIDTYIRPSRFLLLPLAIVVLLRTTVSAQQQFATDNATTVQLLQTIRDGNQPAGTRFPTARHVLVRQQRDAKKSVAKKLVALQNSDGGWSQLPTKQSDAYATGEALYALSESGVMNLTDDVFAKEINYLLQTQDETGAWLVTTRLNPIQSFVNSGFPPLDESQYISAAATNWTTLALVNALSDK